MEKNKTNISIKDALLYFGRIQFAVVISFVISIPFITLIRLFTDIRTLQDVIWGIIGLLLECGMLIYIFYKEKKEDRSLDQGFVIKTISFALIPHFILSSVLLIYFWCGCSIFVTCMGQHSSRRVLKRPERCSLIYVYCFDDTYDGINCFERILRF